MIVYFYISYRYNLLSWDASVFASAKTRLGRCVCVWGPTELAALPCIFVKGQRVYNAAMRTIGVYNLFLSCVIVVGLESPLPSKEGEGEWS